MTQETDNKAASLRRRVLGTPNRYWSLGDLDDPSAAELRELSRLVAAGELMRVRRGLYWRGVRTPFGMTPPDEVGSVRAVTGNVGSGPAGASAALELGLASQVPAVAVVATVRRTTAPHDVAVRFVTRPARIGRVSAKLRPAEVALLEVLETWETSVETPAAEAVARLRDLVHSGTIDLRRIVRSSPSEPATVRARLSALLNELGESDLADLVIRPRTPRLSEDARRMLASAA